MLAHAIYDEDTDCDGRPVTPIAAIFRGLRHSHLAAPFAVSSCGRSKAVLAVDGMVGEAAGDDGMCINIHLDAPTGQHAMCEGTLPRITDTQALQPRAKPPPVLGDGQICLQMSTHQPAKELVQARESAQRRRLEWMKLGCVMYKFHFSSAKVDPRYIKLAHDGSAVMWGSSSSSKLKVVQLVR